MPHKKHPREKSAETTDRPYESEDYYAAQGPAGYFGPGDAKRHSLKSGRMWGFHKEPTSDAVDNPTENDPVSAIRMHLAENPKTRGMNYYHEDDGK